MRVGAAFCGSAPRVSDEASARTLGGGGGGGGAPWSWGAAIAVVAFGDWPTRGWPSGIKAGLGFRD